MGFLRACGLPPTEDTQQASFPCAGQPVLLAECQLSAAVRFPSLASMGTSVLVGSSRRGVATLWTALWLTMVAACVSGESAPSEVDETGEGGASGGKRGDDGEGGVGGKGGVGGDDGEGGVGGDDGDEAPDAAEGGAAGGAGGAGDGEGGAGTAGAGGSGGAAGGSGGAGTAGTGGGAGTAGAAGSPSAQACNTNRFCDDFEMATKGASPAGYTVTLEGEATVQVDETRAFSGKRSVKIVGKGDMGSEGSIAPKQAGLFPMADTYMRMMVYLDKAPAGSKLHWTWVRALGNVKADTADKIVLATTGIGGHPTTWQETQIGVQASTPQLVDCWNHTNEPMPIGKWACIEYHLKDAGDQHEVWVDGQKVPGLNYNLTPTGKSYGCLNDVTGRKFYVGPTSIVRFGWRHAHQLQSPVTLWIDDVAVDDKRIGCPQK